MPRVLNQFGRPWVDEAELHARIEWSAARRSRLNEMRAKYDAAQTTTDNERHWINADLLDANAAANPAVRQKLRSRARYECLESNRYGKGIVLALANDTIGTGPRLQLQRGNEKANRRIQQSLRRWTREVRLGEEHLSWLATTKRAADLLEQQIGRVWFAQSFLSA